MKKEEIEELIQLSDWPDFENQTLENLEKFWIEVGKIADIIISIHNDDLKNACQLQKENYSMMEQMRINYPELNDIETACLTIKNGMSNKFNIISNEYTKELKKICSKWIYNFNIYKKKVVDKIINEIEEKH
jgi:hypothetical protein